jgi:hypothetical protein
LRVRDRRAADEDPEDDEPERGRHARPDWVGAVVARAGRPLCGRRRRTCCADRRRRRWKRSTRTCAQVRVHERELRAYRLPRHASRFSLGCVNPRGR